MTDQERITALEARIAQLEARLNAAEQRGLNMPSLPSLPTTQPVWPNPVYPGVRFGDIMCESAWANS